MNKNLFFILTALAMLVGLLPGCHGGGAPRYDARLVLADSVLRSNDPDSALQLLTTIDGAKLPSAGDRAYHALLLTQAQYRCYVDITSDSTINVALDYYKHHEGEREKLTRSYIYKGAVTEVLGDPEGAMPYYKQAVSVAAPDDHFNLGYALLRVGCLYRSYLVSDSADVVTIKRALHNFEQVHDSVYILNCLSTIGSCYAYTNDDSAMVYLERADRLAKVLGNKYLDATNMGYMADLKMFSPDPSTVIQAKNMVLATLADADCPYDEHDHMLLIAAFTLSRLNKADSAMLYLNQVDKDSLNNGLRILYNRCHAELARCHGDANQYQYYYNRADDISDSLLSNNMQRQLRDVEAKYDNEVLRNKSLTYKNNWIISLLATALFVGILLTAIMAMRFRLAQRHRQIEESEMIIEQLQSDAKTLATQLNKHQTMSDELKQAIQDQIELFTHLVELQVTNYANSPSHFSKTFARSYSYKQSDNGSFWKSLRAYVNARYNNIIDESLAVFPSLSETDINYLSLYCCNLPTSVIMACMGYKEAHSAYNKKRRVAEALGSPDSLDDYIKMYNSEEN